VFGIVSDDPSHASKASYRSVSFGLSEIASDRHPHGSVPNNTADQPIDVGPHGDAADDVQLDAVLGDCGEGMVSTIGSATTHKDVLENPDHITKHVLSKGLDAGTAYKILSIDIADVDVGDNIGAKLQIDQANADKQIAQAKAEGTMHDCKK
jgi:hypothetical protein